MAIVGMQVVDLHEAKVVTHCLHFGFDSQKRGVVDLHVSYLGYKRCALGAAAMRSTSSGTKATGFSMNRWRPEASTCSAASTLGSVWHNRHGVERFVEEGVQVGVPGGYAILLRGPTGEGC